MNNALLSSLLRSTSLRNFVHFLFFFLLFSLSLGLNSLVQFSSSLFSLLNLLILDYLHILSGQSSHDLSVILSFQLLFSKLLRDHFTVEAYPLVRLLL